MIEKVIGLKLARHQLFIIVESILLMLVNWHLAILTVLILVPSRILAEFLVYRTTLGPYGSYILSNTVIFISTLSLFLFTKLLNINEIILIVSYVILTSLLIIKNSKVSTSKNVHVTTSLNASLMVSFLVTLIGAVFSRIVNRTYLPDEASYTFAAQLLKVNDYTYSLRYPIVSPIEKYLGSRLLWIAYLFFANDVLGVPPPELYTMTSLFLAFLTSVVMAFYDDLFELKEIKYNVILTILTLTSPLVLLWSLTSLIDLAESYFILSSIYFTVKCLAELRKGNIKLFLEYLLISLYFDVIDVIFMKSNIISVGILLCMLTFYVFINVFFGKLRLPRELKFLIYLIVAIILGFIFVDLAYFLSIHIFKNITVGIFLRRLLIYGTSFTELVIGWFVSYPWKPRTLFSYSLEEWIRKLNFAISPELNGLMVAGVMLFPFWLNIRSAKKEVRVMLLGALSSFLLYFINFGLLDNFHDISRYCLHLYIVFIMFALIGAYNIFFRSNKISVFFLSLLLPLLVNVFVKMNFDGTTFFWIIKPYSDSGRILIFEYLVTICFVAFVKRIKKENIKLKVFIVFLIFFLVTRLFFIKIVLDNDLILFSSSGRFLNKLALDIEGIQYNLNGNSSIVLSNFHIFLRNFLDPQNFVVAPMPLSVDDFCDLVKVVPKGTLIVITNNWKLSYYTVINSYLFKLLTKENVVLPCGVQIARIKFYQYEGFSYAIFVKETPPSNSSPSRHVSIKQSFVWENRSCLVKISNLTDREYSLMYTVKFSYLLRPNATSVSFPYIDPTTKMDLAFQTCYIIFLVKPQELNMIGFGVISLRDLCVLLAFQEIFLGLILYMMINRKQTF